jgi:hypothetical protein
MGQKYKLYKSECKPTFMAEFDSMEHSDLFEEFVAEQSLDISEALLTSTSTKPSLSKNKVNSGLKKGFFNK